MSGNLSLIGKVATAAAAPVAAAVAVQPVRWHPLGYSVEAGSLCAGLLLCVAVRVWAGARTRTHRWTVDIPVFVVVMMFTVAAIITVDANLATACVLGTGFAAIGEGLIWQAMKYAEKWLGDEPAGKEPS